MSTAITLEAIKAEHAKIAEMITKFEKQPPQFTTCTVAFPPLNKGELWVGVIISADGTKRHHVILLPGEIEDAGWKKSMEWAAGIGGDLPDRCEQSLLFAFMREHFKPERYWSNTQHAADSDYAWFQYFDDGYQGFNSTYIKLRARAVRRLIIE